jgi:hypothetical protein
MNMSTMQSEISDSRKEAGAIQIMVGGKFERNQT